MGKEEEEKKKVRDANQVATSWGKKRTNEQEESFASKSIHKNSRKEDITDVTKFFITFIRHESTKGRERVRMNTFFF